MKKLRLTAKRKSKFNFRKDLEYNLADIDLVILGAVRKELIIPENLKKEAVYFLYFSKDNSKAKYNHLFRITKDAQPIEMIKNHESVNEIIHELKDSYNKKHKKERICLRVPIRGGKNWLSNTNPTYEPEKRLEEFYVIHPTKRNNLAGKFEKILYNYGVIHLLDKEGKRYLNQKIKDIVSRVENL
ncbi:MAG: hypothetical protein AABW81_03705 [Nanoarchaeota archaeon]